MVDHELFRQLKHWFRLFRWVNLLMIALTMILVRYALIHPLLGNDIPYPFSGIDFYLLVLSIVFIAAGGYLINDYFDLKIDRINKPEKLVLGTHIKLSQALTVHQVFSAVGIILGFYTAYKAGSFRLGGIQAIMVAVLWYYSYRYKGLFFWGNFVVSLLTGMSVLLVWLFEFFALKQDVLAFGSAISGFTLVNRFILAYFVFCFLLIFVREIIKDIIDLPGDSQYHCRSIPIICGVKNAANTAAGILTIILLILIGLQIFFLPGFSKPLWIYSVIVLDLPLLYLTFILFQSKENRNYHKISNLLKFLLLAGILSMICITL